MNECRKPVRALRRGLYKLLKAVYREHKARCADKKLEEACELAERILSKYPVPPKGELGEWR